MKKAVFKGYGFVTLFLCVALLMMAFDPAGARAEQTPSRTVRVGYYQVSRFQEGMPPAEEKSGYSYEYLQKVSYYSGWKYEYVYGSWTEIYDRFVKGDVDVMAGLSYTEEREGQMLFPRYEMGNESYYIYKHDGDTSINGQDATTLTGKKIGSIKNNLMTVRLVDWIRNHQIDVEIIEFDSFDQCNEAFFENRLDGIVATDNNVSSEAAMTPVTKIGEEPYYLAVSVSRPDLLQELNEALAMMNGVEPYALETLQYTYFGNTLVSRQRSEKEDRWLAEHSVLRVGYFDDYLPYCATDGEGNATGIMTDVLDALLREVVPDRELPVEYHAYQTDEEMIRAMTSGELDLIFPVAGSLTNAENEGYFVSAPAATAGMYLVYSGTYSPQTPTRIAVNAANSRQYRYTRDVFPNAEIIECDTVYDCLAAIRGGGANCTIINGARISAILRKADIDNMSYSLLSKSEDRCFAVRAGNDGLLYLINRGLRQIDGDYGVNAINKYTNADFSYTFRDFVRDNAVYVVLVILGIASIIVFLFARDSRHMKQQEKERAKYQKELEENQRKLEEKALEQDRMNAMLDEARRQAEAANNAKTTFLFNMSHDIRTPMNAIIGFTTLLEMYQDNPEKRADYLKKIRDSSTVLLSIINNILEMARIEKGTLEMDETVWSAEQFNDVLCSVFQEMMIQKNITFTSRVAVQNHYVYCDPVKLREIFINILSNAYKYTNPGGRVDLLLEEMPCERKGYTLYRTTISDTGIGMSQAFLPHIFEEFSRENTSTENKIEGTGLGMPIVKRLVDFMQGSIEVSSEKGVGTTFVVTIPHRMADPSSVVKLAGVELDPELFRGKRILLAEDNDLNAEIAMEILKEAGFEVERAQDGQAAVEMVERADAGYYHLVLMDIQMPRMNGYEATRSIRAMPDAGKATLPILAMTANAFDEDKKEAVRAGMNGHLAKPIDARKLMKALEDILRLS